MTAPGRGPLHHVELWVPDLTRAEREWGWLLGRLGYTPFQDRPAGRSWRLGETYLVVERSPAMTAKISSSAAVFPDPRRPCARTTGGVPFWRLRG
jgi:hypothetical protein